MPAARGSMATRRVNSTGQQRGASRAGWLFGLLGLVLLLLVALVWLFPASTAVGWAEDSLKPLKLDGVSGSVWNGQGQASIHGQALGRLRWQASPLSLLGLKQRTQLQLDGGQVSAELDLEPAGPNQIRLYPSHVRVPAQLAAPVLDVPALQLHGDIDIDLESALIGMALPKDVTGRAVWRAASVSGPAQAVLGDLEASFESPPGGGLTGRLRDLGGPLMLDGEFHLDYRGYSASATLRARDDNRSVREALRYIGEPQADGSSRFELQGKLLGLP